MGVDASHLGAELSQYGKYGRGSDSDPYGKAVFPHAPDPEQQLPFYIAHVTPVVSCTLWRSTMSCRGACLVPASYLQCKAPVMHPCNGARPGCMSQAAISMPEAALLKAARG